MHLRFRVWLLQSVTVVRGGGSMTKRPPAKPKQPKDAAAPALLLARVVPAF